MFVFSIGVPTAVPLPSSASFKFATDKRKKTRKEELQSSRYMPMMDDYQVMGVFCIPGQSTAGYVLFSQPVLMSNTSVHDCDNDHGHHQASSTTLMGIDAVASTDETHERVVLLDVERDSAQYGSTTQLTNGGADSILY